MANMGDIDGAIYYRKGERKHLMGVLYGKDNKRIFAYVHNCRIQSYIDVAALIKQLYSESDIDVYFTVGSKKKMGTLCMYNGKKVLAYTKQGMIQYYIDIDKLTCMLINNRVCKLPQYKAA